MKESSGISQLTGHLLWLLSNRWQKELREQLLEIGLTYSEALLMSKLVELQRLNQTVTQNQLAKSTGLDKMVVSNIVKALQKKEILEQQTHSIDTRSKTLTITQMGKTILEEAELLTQAYNRRFFNILEPHTDILNAYLRTLLTQS